MKKILVVVGCLIGFPLLLGYFGVIDLHMLKIFGVKKQNVRREIFEQTKSYTHGKTQDLARYYEQYQKPEDRDAVANIIKMQFSDFDETKIRNLKLRSFLISVRGY